MKKGLQLLLFLLFYSLSISAQVNRYGTPLISSFDAAQIPGNPTSVSVTMDGSGVMYFGTEAGGIVTFDGTTWNLIRTPGAGRINAMATDIRGLVYAGGEDDFGFLQPDLSGRLTWQPLTEMISDSAAAADIGSIKSIAADSNSVFLTDGKMLFSLATGSDSVMVTNLEISSGISAVSNLVAFDKRIIIADNKEGLFDYSEGRISRIPAGEKIRNTRIVRMVPYDRDNLLIAAAGKGLILFNIKTGALNNNFTDRRGSAILRNGTLTDLVILPGNMIAAGLDNGGGVCIFSHEGALLQHISEQTASVEESSVMAMYCDYTNNSQLWFCTRGFINLACVSMPAGEIGKAAGIMPGTISVIGFADSVFVSANDGLYKSNVDKSGVMRFRRIRSQGVRVNDMITCDLPEGEVLIAATPNGLLQIDIEGDATRYLSRTRLTTIRTGRENSSVMIAGSDDGTIRTLLFDDSEWMVKHMIIGGVNGAVMDIEESAPGEWWIATESPSSLVRMHCEVNDTTFIRYGRDKGLQCDTINSLSVIDDRLYVCTGKGIYRYNRQHDSFEKDHELAGANFDNASVSMLFRTPEGETVLSGFDTRNFDALVTTTRQGPVVFRRQFDFLPDIPTTGIAWIDGNVWLAKGRSLFVVDKSKLGFNYGTFKTIFTRITSGDNVLMDGTFFTLSPEGRSIPSSFQPDKPVVRLMNRNNDITFRWSTTSYVGVRRTEYRSKLEGYDDDWSGWDVQTQRDYTNLPAGEYVFLLKARTVTGPENEDSRYAFVVWKPWYASLIAKLLYAVLAGWIVYKLIRFYARRLHIRNRRLESLLKQRNEATAKGREEVAGLEKYAGIIQQAIQSSGRRLIEAMPDSFILNSPKGPVSGDFFWMANIGERTIMAVGDCTGHGVPSSLRTIMAHSFMDEICSRPEAISTSAILQEFRRKLSETFGSLPESDVQQEGIDISVLSIDRAGKSVGYSGAASQCFRVREMNDQELARWENGEFKPNEGTLVSGKHLLETVYGDRIPLGMHLDGEHEFTQHTWKLERKSSYYLFTDGYADQFNGLTGKKFLKKNLRKLILDIRNFPMSKQKEILSERLGSWMGKAPQTDDILVVGLRIE